MCAGVLLLVVNDALAKTLVAHLDPFQILFARSLLALPLVAAAAVWSGGASSLRSARPFVHLARAALAVAATYLFIRSLGMLPLVEATAIIFTAPIFVAALSVPLLGQRVGELRLAAVATGFVGALIAIRPGTEAMQPASLMALLAAFLNALVMMSARWIDARDGFWTMTVWMTLFSGVLCAPTLAADWSGLDGEAGLLLGAMAVAGTLGIALITQAFRMGDAAAVAPFDYTALIWASVIGWMVWGTVPGWPVYFGAAVIAAGGSRLGRSMRGVRGTTRNRRRGNDGVPLGRAERDGRMKRAARSESVDPKVLERDRGGSRPVRNGIWHAACRRKTPVPRTTTDPSRMRRVGQSWERLRPPRPEPAREEEADPAHGLDPDLRPRAARW